MRRLLPAVCLAAILALLHVSQARACINDRETVRTESEFKKHYEFKSGYQDQHPAESPSTRQPYVPLAVSLSGIVLLGCAAFLMMSNVRRFGRSS
jgi:hypothetical protein